MEETKVYVVDEDEQEAVKIARQIRKQLKFDCEIFIEIHAFLKRCDEALPHIAMIAIKGKSHEMIELIRESRHEKDVIIFGMMNGGAKEEATQFILAGANAIGFKTDPEHTCDLVRHHVKAKSERLAVI